MAPLKDVHVLIPETCEYVILHCKGFYRCDYIKELEMGQVSWIIESQ